MGPRFGSIAGTGGHCCGVLRRFPSAPPDDSAASSVRVLFVLWASRSSRSSSSRSSEGPSRGCIKGSRAWIGRFLTRISLRIRILIPWSASEHDNGVDSI